MNKKRMNTSYTEVAEIVEAFVGNKGSKKTTKIVEILKEYDMASPIAISRNVKSYAISHNNGRKMGYLQLVSDITGIDSSKSLSTISEWFKTKSPNRIPLVYLIKLAKHWDVEISTLLK